MVMWGAGGRLGRCGGRIRRRRSISERSVDVEGDKKGEGDLICESAYA